MTAISKIVQLAFVPRSIDLGLLALRVGTGLSLFVRHGWGKISKVSDMAQPTQCQMHSIGLGNESDDEHSSPGSFFWIKLATTDAADAIMLAGKQSASCCSC